MREYHYILLNSPMLCCFNHSVTAFVNFAVYFAQALMSCNGNKIKEGIKFLGMIDGVQCYSMYQILSYV